MTNFQASYNKIIRMSLILCPLKADNQFKTKLLRIISSKYILLKNILHQTPLAGPNKVLCLLGRNAGDNILIPLNMTFLRHAPIYLYLTQIALLLAMFYYFVYGYNNSMLSHVIRTTRHFEHTLPIIITEKVFLRLACVVSHLVNQPVNGICCNDNPFLLHTCIY